MLLPEAPATAKEVFGGPRGILAWGPEDAIRGRISSSPPATSAKDGSPIPPLRLDGTAGAKTKQAALAFQTAAHLATDAIVGPLTWRKLLEQDF